MRAIRHLVVLSLALAGCSSATLDPAPSPVLEAPELSQPREPRKTADPPPPIREQRLPSAYTSQQQAAAQAAQAAQQQPAATSSPSPSSSSPETTGKVNALERTNPEDEKAKPPIVR